MTGQYAFESGNGLLSVNHLPVPAPIGAEAGGADTETILITVHEVNQAPTLDAITVPDVDDGTAVTFAAHGHDADLVGGAPNGLTYSLVGAPGGSAVVTRGRATIGTAALSYSGDRPPCGRRRGEGERGGGRPRSPNPARAIPMVLRGKEGFSAGQKL